MQRQYAPCAPGKRAWPGDLVEQLALEGALKVVGFLDRHDETIDHPLAVVAVDLRNIGSHDREPVDLDRALTGRSPHVRQQRVVDIVFTVAGDVDDEAAALADEERQSGTERAADPGLAAQAVRRLAPILLRAALFGSVQSTTISARVSNSTIATWTSPSALITLASESNRT